MTDVLSKAMGRREQLANEIERIDQFIATYYELSGQTLAPEPQRVEAKQQLEFTEASSPICADLPDKLVKELTFKEQVRICHEYHPDWHSEKIAEHLEISAGAVRNYASQLKIKLPKKTPALADKIKAIQAKNPDALATDLALELDTSPSAINWAASQAGIEINRLSPEELAERKRQNGLKAQETLRKKRKVTDAPKHKDAPKPAGAPKPAPAASPASTAALPGKGGITKPLTKPKGARFYLREKLGSGKFLHFSCMSLTNDRDYAWIGSQQQLLACRKAFSLAADLVEEVVEK